jgi:hypothetical protein
VAKPPSATPARQPPVRTKPEQGQLLQIRKEPPQLRKSRNSAKPKSFPIVSENHNFDFSLRPVGRFEKSKISAEQNDQSGSMKIRKVTLQKF